MANLRDLRNRITSIKNTKQITNAMKMVSASRLRKAQDTVVRARPYSDYVDLMLRILQKKNVTNPHPMLISPNKDGRILLIVVTGDRGLCGSFNSTIIRYANQYIRENSQVDLVCIGRKAYDTYKKRSNLKIVAHFGSITEIKDISDLKQIRNEVINLFFSMEYQKVDVIYNEFKSAIQQNLTCKQIMPIIPTESDEVSTIDFLYEPNETEIIEELGTRYVSVELWRILLESNAAEQGSRMTAMDNATNNATDLIEQLSLLYNRERQAQITTEIIEVASGAEAIQQ